MKLSILVSTDDAAVIITLSNIFNSRNYHYSIESRLSKSFLKLLEPDWNIFVMDTDKPDDACLDSIKFIQRMCPDVALIVLLNTMDIHFIRKLSQLGIYYYIIKPLPNIEVEQVLSGLDRFLRVKQNKKRNTQLQNIQY